MTTTTTTTTIRRNKKNIIYNNIEEEEDNNDNNNNVNDGTNEIDDINTVLKGNINTKTSIIVKRYNNTKSTWSSFINARRSQLQFIHIVFMLLYYIIFQYKFRVHLVIFDIFCCFNLYYPFINKHIVTWISDKIVAISNFMLTKSLKLLSVSTILIIFLFCDLAAFTIIQKFV